jgi:hypothetical protein
MATLSAPPAVESIVERIERESEIVCCHPDRCGCDSQFERVIYCIRVSKALFDLFFNSRTGYRGSYFESPYRGLEANAFLIETLRPKLIAWSRKKATCCDPNFVEDSLRALSAKAWLAEVEKEFCEHCRGEWPETTQDTRIKNGRWEYADRFAGWGQQAPYLTKIRVFGAFLNCQRDEFIPHDKRHRADDIHKWGWS